MSMLTGDGKLQDQLKYYNTTILQITISNYNIKCNRMVLTLLTKNSDLGP